MRSRGTGTSTEARKQVAQGPRIRRSRASRWRAAVLVGVHLLFLGHLVHWLSHGTTLSPLEPSEAMQVAQQGVVNAGALFFALAIVSTALCGRFFCGWGCHLVALQDLCRWLLLKAGVRPRPLGSRLLLWVPTIAFVYMFLWPAIYRLWSGQPGPRLRVVLTTSHLWATFPPWGVATLTFLVCGFAAVYVLGAKGFCTYACPYGAAFGAAARLAPIAVRVTDACCGAAHCTASCTSNVRVHEEVRNYGMVVNPGCMKCLDCVSVCPNDALYVGLGRPALLARARPGLASTRRSRWVGRAEETLLAAAFGAAFLTFRGLYGVVPFLLSLGIAAILAALVLLCVRLLRRPELRFGGWWLRRAGRLQPAGWVASALTAAALLLWGHSALVHLHASLGNAFYRRTAPLRLAALDLDRPLEPVVGRELELVERTVRHLELAERWGLLSDPRSDLRVAWMDLLAGRTEASQRRVEAALAAQPRAAEPYLLLGRGLAARGRFEEAAAAYARAVEADPRDPTSYLGLGTLLARLGDFEGARAISERGLALLPDNPDLLYNAGVASALLGDATGAIARFEQVLAVDPEHRKARENLAGVLLGTGRSAEAVAHLRAAVARAPGDATDHLLLGRSYLALGDLDAAETELRAALAVDPHLGEAEALLAEIAERRRGSDTAAR